MCGQVKMVENIDFTSIRKIFLPHAIKNGLFRVDKRTQYEYTIEWKRRLQWK